MKMMKNRETLRPYNSSPTAVCFKRGIDSAIAPAKDVDCVPGNAMVHDSGIFGTEGLGYRGMGSNWGFW